MLESVWTVVSSLILGKRVFSKSSESFSLSMQENLLLHGVLHVDALTWWSKLVESEVERSSYRLLLRIALLGNEVIHKQLEHCSMKLLDLPLLAEVPCSLANLPLRSASATRWPSSNPASNQASSLVVKCQSDHLVDDAYACRQENAECSDLPSYPEHLSAHPWPSKS